MKKLLLASLAPLCLLGTSALADHTGSPSFTDAFDVSTGTVVTNNSPEHGLGIVSEDMFGASVGSFAPEVGHTIFDDSFLSPDFVEFTTAPLPFALSSVHLIAQADGGAGADRGLQSFSLFANFGAGYVLIGSQSGLNAIQDANGGLADLVIPASAPAGTTLFRAEFVRDSNGPRIVELDAVLVPEPTSLGLLGLGALGLLARRRRRA